MIPKEKEPYELPKISKGNIYIYIYRSVDYTMKLAVIMQKRRAGKEDIRKLYRKLCFGRR